MYRENVPNREGMYHVGEVSVYQNAFGHLFQISDISGRIAFFL